MTKHSKKRKLSPFWKTLKYMHVSALYTKKHYLLNLFSHVKPDGKSLSLIQNIYF